MEKSWALVCGIYLSTIVLATALAGLPPPRADHADAACAMALDMLEVMLIAAERESEPLEVRIGIHSGAVLRRQKPESACRHAGNCEYLPRDHFSSNIHTPLYTHELHEEVPMNSLKSRVFNNGNSQAVRIPAEFRLDTDQVQISRNEQGDLIIHPLRVARGKALLQALEGFDEDFIAFLEAERETPIPMQDRDEL